MKEYRLLQFVQRQSTQTFDASRGAFHAPANLEFDGAIAPTRDYRLLTIWADHQSRLCAMFSLKIIVDIPAQ
jgi:hypothetical protein